MSARIAPTRSRRRAVVRRPRPPYLRAALAVALLAATLVLTASGPEPAEEPARRAGSGPAGPSFEGRAPAAPEADPPASVPVRRPVALAANPAVDESAVAAPATP